MRVHLFSKPGCVVCIKAAKLLKGHKIPFDHHHVEGPDATVDDVAAFSWYGWVDKLPLVVVTHTPETGRESVCHRYGSEDVQRGFTRICKRIRADMADTQHCA